MHYLDNGATTWPKPEIVYETLDNSFRHMFSPKRGSSKASRAGKSVLQEARQSLASLFHIEQRDRLIFTNGATHSLNLAIQSFPWKSGDGVVMSAIEHHALSRPIRKMAQEKGIQFFVVPYTDNTPFDLAHYESLLQNSDNRIRMVATTHASNVIGCVLPIREIGRLAHQYGAIYLVDVAQTAGVYPIDVKADHIDLLAVPGHKALYGPPGVGALYIGNNVPLNTFMEGGTGNDSGTHPMKPSVPDGFEVGTIALPNILAFSAGTQWVQEQGLEKIQSHEKALLETLLHGLQDIPEVTVYGHQNVAEKTAVVSFRVQDTDSKIIANQLYDEFGIALRAGFHCAPMAHEAIGTIHTPGGTIRASLGFFTQQENIDALLSALKHVIAHSTAATH